MRPCQLGVCKCLSSEAYLIHDASLNIETQIYPIDSAKSIYQRNCLTSEVGNTKKPKIQFFNRRMYRGMCLCPYNSMSGSQFLAGLGVSMGRSCVVNAIFFSAFEFMKKRINRLEVDEDIIRRGESF